MSLHFDMVLNCDLREDTPLDVIEAIKCLTSRDYELKEKPQLIYPDVGNIWDSFYDHHFLAPDPEREIISNFQRIHRTTIPLENHREVYRYSLQYCGRWIHDDTFYHDHIPFVYWLATVAYDNYLGYFMETHSTARLEQSHFIVTNGKLKD